MEKFTAQEARALAQKKYESTLQSLLDDIRVKASEGEFALHIYKPVDKIVLTALEKRGFEVSNHPSIAMQRENLYYTISW